MKRLYFQERKNRHGVLPRAAWALQANKRVFILLTHREVGQSSVVLLLKFLLKRSQLLFYLNRAISLHFIQLQKMSLQIIKPGILDTIQDLGRQGYRHLGIGPSGAVDHYAASLANCLLGKPVDKPVIEMHFPAATIRFSAATIICLTGANFSAEAEGVSCRLNQPVAVAAGTVLHFT